MLGSVLMLHERISSTVYELTSESILLYMVDYETKIQFKLYFLYNYESYNRFDQSVN